MKIFDLLFSEGNRKLLLSFVAIVVTVVSEKYGVGLSVNALDAIVQLVAIFAGANAAEHFANALKLKHTPAPLVEQEVVAQDLSTPEQPKSTVTVEQVANYAQKIASDSTERFKLIESLLQKQGNSIQGLVNHINGKRNDSAET